MAVFNKIKNRLALAFVSVAIIPAVVIGVYSVQVSSTSLLEREYSAQEQGVDSAKQSISAFLGTAKGDVLYLSQVRPMVTLLKLQEEGGSEAEMDVAKTELEKELQAFAQQRGIYYQVRYLNETGLEVVRVDYDGKTASIRAWDRMQNKGGRYYFADSVGLPAGSVFVSPLDLNRERGQVEVPHKPVIRYAVPVKYSNGADAGVVLTNVDASQFLNALGDKWLVDGKGYYLAHTDPAKSWGSDRDLGSGQSLNKDYPGNAAAIMGGGQKGREETETQVITYETVAVPGADDRHWLVLSVRQFDDLLKSVRSFQTTFLAILIGALLVALLVAWVLDRKITKPIEYLTEQADKVSMGELLNPIEMDDKSEIGKLADAFERMRVSMVRALERRRRKK